MDEQTPVINPVGCRAPRCDRAADVKRLCRLHYQRLRNRGSLELPTVADRFWSKVRGAVVDDCWTWAAHRNHAGYGQFGTGGRIVLAHRWSYEQLIAPIENGATLDHLCRNPACVNPWHLEQVPLAENIRRAAAVRDYGPPMSRCGNGHPMTPENAYRRPGRRNSLACRACMREYQRAFQARKAAAK